MSKKLPEIRIKDAWLLRQNASRHLHELWGEGKTLADDEWMEKRVGEYQLAWKPFEKTILESMCNITGLKFFQNTVDVYVAPWFGAFSDPLVIGVMREPDEFVDTLTHELLHRLLTDNTSLPPNTRLLTIWQELFGKNQSFATLVHIPVHAIHKAIYLDTLNQPERLERDKKSLVQLKASDYIKSWEYVDQHGYKEIIKKLKNSYKKLEEKQ